METVSKANERRSRLLSRPGQLVTEIVWISLIHGLSVFAGPNESSARSLLEFIDGCVWYTISFRVFTAGGFNIPLGNLTFVLQGNGQYLPSANSINAPLQFGQVKEYHPNHLRPQGLTLRDMIILWGKLHNLIY